MTTRSQDLNKFAKDPYKKHQSSGKASTFHIIQIMCSLMAQWWNKLNMFVLNVLICRDVL